MGEERVRAGINTRLDPSLFFSLSLEFEFVDEGDRHKGPRDNLPSRPVVVVV